MTCPYDAVNNGYSGSMTCTFMWMTTVTGGAVNNRMFGRIGTFDGFSTGQIDDAYVFTSTGVTDGVSDPAFSINDFQVASLVFDAGTADVDFYKNSVYVSTANVTVLNSNTNDLVLGGFNDFLTNLNWAGDLVMLGWAWRKQSVAEITAMHNYALGRLGV
jgi:hypothetical protein